MGDVPLRRSLLLRLLAVTALVSVCSIAATAWLTVRSTTVALRQEQGQALSDDARVYDALLGYAAGHPSWSGAAETVRRLARETGHRVTLTTEDREPVLDSDPGPITLPAKPTAVIEPLAVDTPDHIDPRAVGPFRLPAGERDQLRAAAQRRAACLRDALANVTATVAQKPSGRSYVETRNIDPTTSRCAGLALDRLTPTETKALDRLSTSVNACLQRRDLPEVRLGLDFSWSPVPAPVRPAGTGSLTESVQKCVTASRREQLAPYVAPTALLFVGSRAGPPSTIFDLSPANQVRIAGVAALVLLATVAVTVLSGVRLVRPLRALTGAVRRMERGDLAATVQIARKDEIGRLAAAFNAMSVRRTQLEGLRKAMVSDVAHELRTPLSNIRGWLEATEDGLVAPGRALISSLLEEALLLQHIIDDLQDLAVADAGELRLHRERFDVTDLLAQVAQAHRSGADAAGVTLSPPAGAPLEVHADPVRLRQAVGNLISNAIRHTPPGGAVALRARRDGDGTVIEVADTGTGIGADDLPLIFERFWRVDRSRNRRTGGSGLGLSIVRKLLEAHGGTASATSTPGQGSTFTLRLPGDVAR
ncbi:two-component sensor histidine kinase [Acrocarpospora corrugata]|uniref:histidine kinase n=1 Tax=Acrocarpospora corrugata TaxID=35763 RepID=A0A5M3W7G2_9ACTN|nr:HAMP domain-containing sensor histidine kinase [Acrocarpospora corrugata]GES03892.1 two-component sensor histidine kinase [Acrocarpospora corrugata]